MGGWILNDRESKGGDSLRTLPPRGSVLPPTWSRRRLDVDSEEAVSKQKAEMDRVGFPQDIHQAAEGSLPVTSPLGAPRAATGALSPDSHQRKGTNHPSGTLVLSANRSKNLPPSQKSLTTAL